VGNRRSILDRARILARLAARDSRAADRVAKHLLAHYTPEGARKREAGERSPDVLDVERVFPVVSSLAAVADVCATYGDAEGRRLALEALREIAEGSNE
jgi:hypothetical protein